MSFRWRAALAIAVVLVPALARADDLVVSTDEAGSWPASVAAMQADLHAQGRVLHVHVHDTGGASVPCSQYTLVLDETSSAAFTVGRCDVDSGATELTLVNRAALFETDDVAPRPRLAGISAVQVRTGGARGGAVRTGASEVACTLAVRPYVEDLQNGRHVFLTPGRFVLRPLGANVTVDAMANGWLLRARDAASASVAYEVVDTRTNEVVVHTRATLSCAREESNSAESPGPSVASPLFDAQCANLPMLSTAAPASGSTRVGTAHPAYALHLDRERHVGVVGLGDFVGEIDVFRGCGPVRRYEGVLRISPIVVDQSLTLSPGDYSLEVEDHDRRPHAGAFSISLRFDPNDPEPNLH